MTTNQLFGEILLAGGRRHACKEEELCEDAAGLHFFDKGVVFYISDGTSDETGVGPFSSRYLANSLGYYFIETFLDNNFSKKENVLSEKDFLEERFSFPPPSPLLKKMAREDEEDIHVSDVFPDVVSVFHEALDRLSQAWKKELIFFQKKEENRDLLKEALVPYQDPKNDASCHLLSFSTTFCAGVLKHEGRSLRLIKIGDIDVAVKDKENSLHRLNSHRERLFVQLISCPEKNGIKLVFPTPKYEERSYDDVAFIVTKSDGLRFINDDLSFNLLNGGGKENLLKFRKLLTKGYDRNIGDDKAILYLMYLK